ncbi:ATP-binding cassette domain-containing protein [Nocardia sp. NPDC004604]|uniref:ATP-binding cassette domain-containing protein n=1 Tax=Nocardia sp. NPDC004604 TaxID=3157013 RepID=UPI0033AED517
MSAPVTATIDITVDKAPAVAVRGVRKSYGTTEVLRGIDLTVRAGEVVTVIGPSGSGKSTLLRVINHLESLDAGTVHIDGELIGYRLRRNRLHALSDREVRKQRSHIGFVFQQFNLFPHLTVLDNVTLAPISAQGRPRKEIEREAEELLDRVGIGELADAYPRRLSGGQQQRVAIARALALRPPVEQNIAEGLPAIDIAYFQQVTDYYLALASQRLDGYIGPDPSAIYHSTTANQTKIVATFSGAGDTLQGEIGVLTKRDNGLIGPINKAINNAIQTGTYQQVIDRWGLQTETVPSSRINPPGLPKKS